MLNTLEFLQSLRELALLEATELVVIEHHLAEQTLRPSAPARELAEQLIEKGWLTAFQVERLLEGRGKELLLGPYALLDRLGQGGMGTVFTARHRELGRLVAVKVVRNDEGDADATERFKREARVAAQLDHVNVVRTYDAGEADGVRYIAMEYVPGTNLTHLVQDLGPQPIALACEYVRQAALGLQHIYERGLVHRDVKPSNLLLQPAAAGQSGTVKVLDLGLAGFASPKERDGTARLTETNAVMGTPDFLAPEQASDAHRVDIRADLYSLGCTLYFLLTGQVPFPGVPVPQKLIAHQMYEPEPVDKLRPEVPGTLAAVVRKLMAKGPDERYQTPADLAAALAKIATGLPKVAAAKVPQRRPPPTGDDTLRTWSPVPRRPRSAAVPTWLVPAALALLLAVGIVAVLISMLGHPRPPDSDGVARTDREPAPASAAQAPQTGALPATSLPRHTPPVVSPTTGEELPKTLEIDLGKGVKLEMVRIDPGELWMGSREGVGLPRERPRHKATITRPYYLGKYEVTQEQYERVTGKAPSYFGPAGEGKELAGADTRQFPVDSVSWEDATAFCDALMKQVGDKLPEALRKQGYRFRLPAEAQWEHACRAGTETAYHFGDKLDGKQANCNGKQPFGTEEQGPFPGRTCKVGQGDANAWGLFDMHGNVFEWCEDCFDEKFYTSEDVKDPINLKKDADNRRVLRGGSWYSAASDCRSAYRGWGGASGRISTVGLRCALRVRGAVE